MTVLYVAGAFLSLLCLVALLPSCLATTAETPFKPSNAHAVRTVPRYRRGAVVIGA
jgi:hypothetical protein